jgi:hypothetical protein
MSALGGPGLGGFGGGSSNTGGGNRGPRHGHSNRGKGGGGVYGNPTGLTISEAMATYGVDNLTDLQQSMSTNPANTVNFHALIDDSDTTTTTDTTTDTTTTGSDMSTDTTLDLDHLYKVLLGRGPDAYNGGDIADDAREYWTDHFNTAGGDEAALLSVISGIQGSQEFADLGLDKDTYLTNPSAAEHRHQAQDSVNRGAGVRRGSVASYSDMFNEDGTPNPDWVDLETWNRNMIESLQDENADLTANPVTNTVIQYVDRWHDADTSAYDQRIADLQSTITGMTSDYDDLEDLYNTAQTGYDSLYAAAAYGERPRNMTVRGVRTQNELPGYTPRTTGTGFFSRNRGAGAGLTTSSLNLA